MNSFSKTTAILTAKSVYGVWDSGNENDVSKAHTWHLS